MKGTPTLITAILMIWFSIAVAETSGLEAGVPEGPGLSASYPGDIGLEADANVVFTENFEDANVAELKKRWDNVSNKDGRVLAFCKDIPEASSGEYSLSVTATRGENSGGHLFKVLKPGYDQLYLRFYVKFADDYGFDHHFVHLGGAIDPPRWPVGGAGKKPANSWGTGIEPTPASHNHYPPTLYPPPGIWHFYTYWIEMRSWQGPDGTSFFGNNFSGSVFGFFLKSYKTIFAIINIAIFDS